MGGQKTIWVIKKNRIYYQNGLNVGLKTHYHYCDDIIYAKWFDQITDAKRICDNLNEKNAIDYVKGKWKVIEYNLIQGRQVC